MEENNNLEKFYVYRSLHSDESWGAVLLPGDICRLPNIAFGMKVYASNEKEAVSQAKQVYERIHIYDNDKKNIREFVCAILSKEGMAGTTAIKNILTNAITINEQFNNHFKRLEKNNE